MKNFLGKTTLTITILMILTLVVEVYGISLRNIKRQYYRKNYKSAKKALEREIEELRGGSLIEGKLLLAQLETDVGEASGLYRDVISSGREGAELKARVELAKIHYSLNEYESALDVLGYIPSKGRSGELFEALYFSGLSWKQMGNMERARREFEKVDRGEYLYWSYIALAELDMQSGNIGDAIERYEMIASSHSNPIAGFKLGECYEIMGETEKALNVYRNLVHHFPESLEAPKAREKLQMIDRRRGFRLSRRNTKGGDEGDSPSSSDAPAESETTLYTLQFGAFSVEENARAFAEELGSSIKELRVEKSEVKNRTWYRVRVGIYSSREKAEADALRFMEISGYSSKVLPLE